MYSCLMNIQSLVLVNRQQHVRKNYKNYKSSTVQVFFQALTPKDYLAKAIGYLINEK